MSVSLIKSTPGTFYNDSTGERTSIAFREWVASETPSPLVMPKARKVRTAIPMTALHAHCAQGAACQGPGCVRSTGKTQRKMR